MAIRATSGTTAANAVSTVTFANWYSQIRVTNRGATELWVRTDGVNPTVAASVGGDECDVVLPNSSVVVSNKKVEPDQGAGITSNTVVGVISTAAVAFTVASA